MGSTIYTEVFVLALVLISNVLGNNFVGYIPRTATEIAARLQVPSPKLLLQVRKFRQQMSLKYRVRAPSVFRHPLSLRAARLLKPSPVRRGLQPSQTGTVIKVSAKSYQVFVSYSRKDNSSHGRSSGPITG